MKQNRKERSFDISKIDLKKMTKSNLNGENAEENNNSDYNDLKIKNETKQEIKERLKLEKKMKKLTDDDIENHIIPIYNIEEIKNSPIVKSVVAALSTDVPINKEQEQFLDMIAERHAKYSMQYYYKKIYKIVEEKEKHINQLRELLEEMEISDYYVCDEANKEKLSEKIIADIKLDIKDDLFVLKMPTLLPHRKYRATSFYYKELSNLLMKNQFEKEIVRKRFQEHIKDGAVLIIKSIYKKPHLIRDGDNIEIKELIDLIAMWGFINRDSGEYLRLVMDAEVNPDCEPHTIVTIMSKEDYKTWNGR